jgi:hypothetical protein
MSSPGGPSGVVRETGRPQHGQPRSRSGRRGECMRTLVIILLVRYARRLRPAAGVGASPGQLFPRRSWPLAGGQPTDVRERGAAECCRANRDRALGGVAQSADDQALRRYAGSCAQVARPATWCGIISLSPDGDRVTITASPGAARRLGNGGSRADPPRTRSARLRASCRICLQVIDALMHPDPTL